MREKLIVEKTLGIPADYQYRAINDGLWLQKNWHRNKFEVLKQTITPRKNGKVLDLGTGSGNFELLFSKNFLEIVGVDYNDAALDFLRKQLKKEGVDNVRLYQSDIRELPKDVTNIRFDLVIIVDTIEHIKKKDALGVISRARGLLNRGGELVIVTPNYSSVWIVLENILDKMSIVPKFAGKQHLSRFDRQSLSTAFVRTGFSQIKISSFNLFSFLSPFKLLNLILLKFELRFLRSSGCLIYISGKNI